VPLLLLIGCMVLSWQALSDEVPPMVLLAMPPAANLAPVIPDTTTTTPSSSIV
jgi:hypothetical protein